jgi:predicted phosphodiesterase
VSEERCETLTLPPSAKRVVVLGDPHGDLVAFELILELEAGDDTVFVSVGDNVGYADGRTSSFLCELLVKHNVRSVVGNHEDWCLSDGRLQISPPGLPRTLTPEALEWCQGLPHRLRLESEALAELTVGVVHTLPDWAYVGADSAGRLAELEGTSITFCGHTHKPAFYILNSKGRVNVRRLDPRSATPVSLTVEPGKRYVVDAGSLARPSRPRGRTCPEQGTYAVLDIATRILQLKAIDKGPRLRALMKEWMESQ